MIKEEYKYSEIGLLINFGAKSLEFKRIINKKFNQQGQRPNS